MTKKEVLNKISESAIYGNLGLFIGSGMSKAVLNNSFENVAKDWNELLEEVSNNFEIDFNSIVKKSINSYPEIASKLVKEISNNQKISLKEATSKFKDNISKITSWYPSENERSIYSELLFEINPNWIITTNYDLVLECLLTGKSESLTPNDQLISQNGLIPIYHLHGIRTIPNSIIITQEDYISLFRPNQYRLQKLPLIIKESTTLLIGYGLGDINVLTAVDWSKNVYLNQNNKYPNDIIQLLYSREPKIEPYEDNNGIIIYEMNDLKAFLSDLVENLKEHRLKFDENEKNIKEYDNLFKNPENDDIDTFIKEEKWRKLIIDSLKLKEMKFISGFLYYFSKVMDKAWKNTEPNGAFEAYNQILEIILDLLNIIDLDKIPPALFETIVYNFQRLSFFIGEGKGMSYKATETWNKRKNEIPLAYKNEIINISNARGYYKLLKMVKNI